MSKYQKKPEHWVFKFLKSVPAKAWLGLAGAVALVFVVSWAVSLVKAHPVAAPMFFLSLVTLIGVAFSARSETGAVVRSAKASKADTEAQTYFEKLDLISWRYEAEKPRDYDGQRYWKNRINEAHEESKTSVNLGKIFRAFQDFKYGPADGARPVLKNFVANVVENAPQPQPEKQLPDYYRYLDFPELRTCFEKAAR